MTPPRSIVIAGESIAGITAARQLRDLGHAGPITMIGAENCGAYARPPLSKAVLKDDRSDSTLGYRLDGLGINVVRSPAVTADVDRRVVITANGRETGYDALIIATGARARRIAAPGQRGETVLRTLNDARRLRTRLDAARSALVVGAGFLGLEIASACVARDIPVTVVDVDPPLRRILGPACATAVPGVFAATRRAGSRRGKRARGIGAADLVRRKRAAHCRFLRQAHSGAEAACAGRLTRFGYACGRRGHCGRGSTPAPVAPERIDRYSASGELDKRP